jgi:hypothetical protein
LPLTRCGQSKQSKKDDPEENLLIEISKYIVTGALIVVGVIHLIPVIGVVGPSRLTALYGLEFAEANIAILMRHRAVLFGLLGLLLIIAAFKPPLQLLAFIAGFISVISFLLLALSTGQYSKEISGIVAADVVALICLLVGAMAYAVGRTAVE